MFDQEPDICFIIKDSIPKKGDQDENIRNFEEKLKEAGVDNIKTIIPISKLKQDYKSSNLKMKLCNTYDAFLVESEIAEHVYTILGKHFITKRKRPMQIDMKKEKTFKISIENATKKVSFKLSSSSNLSCFEVGTMKMENVNIADNIMSAIDQLKEKWPGSWKNISRLYLKPMKPSKVTIPIYYSNINPNDVEVPVIQGAKQNRLDKLAEELKKKSKKLKLDFKKKRLVKNAATPKTVDNKDKKAEKSKDKKGSKTKGKKPETDVKESNAELKSEEAAVEPIKKKKKTSITEESAPQKSQEPAKKGKKNKKGNKVEEPVINDAVEPADEPSKKKKKKALKLESNVEESVEQPALEKQKKIKNKNKPKTNLVDKNSVETAVTVSEKEQISIKKKKKDKKNKA